MKKGNANNQDYNDWINTIFPTQVINALKFNDKNTRNSMFLVR